MNAIRVLVDQHRAIRELFGDLEREYRRVHRRRAVARLAEELIAHSAAEEAVVYPAVRRSPRRGASASPDCSPRSPGDTGTARPTPERHLLLRVQLRRVLASNVDDPTFPAAIEALRTSFDAHAREEEGELFPHLARSLSALDLELLGQEIAGARPPIWMVTSEGQPSLDFARVRARVSLPTSAAGD
jgi:hypothetical protein